MEYTNIMLGLLGLLGILLHNLMKMDAINRNSDGNINMLKYWKIERFSILISIIVVYISVIVSDEVRQIKQLGNWRGVGYVLIGYAAQSIVVWARDKVASNLDKKPQP